MKPDREENPGTVFAVLIVSLFIATMGAMAYVAWMWWTVKP